MDEKTKIILHSVVLLILIVLCGMLYFYLAKTFYPSFLFVVPMVLAWFCAAGLGRNIAEFESIIKRERRKIK